MSKGYRTAIHKHYELTVEYADGSGGTRKLEPSSAAARLELANINLDEVLRVELKPVYSEPGETVHVTVQHQG